MGREESSLEKAWSQRHSKNRSAPLYVRSSTGGLYSITAAVLDVVVVVLDNVNVVLVVVLVVVVASPQLQKRRN